MALQGQHTAQAELKDVLGVDADADVAALRGLKLSVNAKLTLLQERRSMTANFTKPASYTAQFLALGGIGRCGNGADAGNSVIC